MIKRNFKLASQNTLFRSLFVMISGTGIAQLLPLISAPIVARLYEPEDFGVYAVFYSIVTILGGVAFLDFHNVIIVEKSHRKAFYSLVLSFFYCLCISFFALLLVLIIPDFWLAKVFGLKVVPFLWIIPITVIVSSLSTLLYTWFLRRAKFSLITKNKIIIAVMAVIVQIGIGLLRVGAIGFIIANLISFLVSTLLFARVFFKELEYSFSKISVKTLKELSKKYKNFPLVSVWANGLNIVTLQLPQFLLNSFFGAYVVGQFSLAHRMINLPISFIATSVQDIFRQNAAAENVDKGHCKQSYKQFFKLGLLIGGASFIGCITFIPSLFVFIFGAKWEPAGVYVRVLALLTAVRFVVAPLSYVFIIKLKQKLDFLWQIGLFVLTLLSLYGGYYWFGVKNAVILLLCYSVLLTLWYIVNAVISFKLATIIDNE